jgi:hypothetical protein
VQPAQNRVTRDAGAGDAATDDEQIELVLGKPREDCSDFVTR